MRILPLPFSRPMALATWEGRKTQTRRVLVGAPTDYFLATSTFDRGDPVTFADSENWQEVFDRVEVKVPFFPGDHLWVREDHYRLGHWEPVAGVKTKGGQQKWAFVADGDDVLFDPPPVFRGGRRHNDPYSVNWYKRLGRFMPRAFSRQTLEVTEVRVQRVQDISEEDAMAEGSDLAAGNRLHPSYRLAFGNLWDSLNLDRGYGWEVNPWVCAVSFRCILKNIDEVLRDQT